MATAGIAAAFDQARGHADFGALALAMQRRDAEGITAAVDWQNLLGKLLLLLEPGAAVAAAREARLGFLALAMRLFAAGMQSSLTAEDLAAAVGVTVAQSKLLAGRAQALAAVRASADRMASTFIDQARHLTAQRVAALSSHAAPRLRPFHAIDAVEAQLAPVLGMRLADAIASARASTDLGRLADAIAARERGAILDALPLGELAAELAAAGSVLRDAYLGGATAGYRSLGGNPDLVDAQAATAWADARAVELADWIRGTGEAAALATLASVEAFSADSVGAAQLIRDRLGLTGKEAAAAARRYADLVASGANREAASAASSAYATELEKARIERFGGDTSYSAANAGQLAGWKQAEREGLARGLARFWLTREDNGVCPVCNALTGQQRGLGEPFYSDPKVITPPTAGRSGGKGDGHYYMNPGDPHDRCRCAALVVSIVDAAAAGRTLAEAA